MKSCSMCHEAKPLEAFSPLAHGLMGRASRCRACRNAVNRETYPAAKDKRAAATKAWQAQNKDRVRDAVRRYRAKLGDSAAATKSAQNAAWRAANRTQRAAEEGSRRQALTTRQLASSPEAILAVYERARLLTLVTGVRHEVDHEVPLRGEQVSGLHVPANLRCIPATDNRRKKNTYEAAA